MVHVFVTKEENRITCVEMKGHAGYAPNGKDIVCSAISAVAGAMLLGVIHFSTRKVDYRQDEESGYLKLIVPNPESETERIQIDAIVTSGVLALRDIEKGYARFIKVEDR